MSARISVLDEFYDQAAQVPTTMIPKRAKVEIDFPVRGMYDLAAKEGNRKRPVYEMHKWWARRLGSNFRMLLLASLKSSRKWTRSLWRDFYSSNALEDLVVLDPFMGGGTSIVESAKAGARVIGVDIDPVAWFVTKKEIEPCDLPGVRAEYERILKDIRQELGHLYRTRDSQGHECESINFFWVDSVACPRCSRRFEAHPSYKLAADKRQSIYVAFCRSCGEIESSSQSFQTFVCRKCGALTNIGEGTVRLGRFTCPSCSKKFPDSRIAVKSEPIQRVLFAVEYYCDACEGRSYKKADGNDLELFAEAKEAFEKEIDKLPFPRTLIPTDGRSDSRPVRDGYVHYSEMFNARQLLGLSRIYESIRALKNREVMEYLLLAFSDSLASNNMFCYYAFGYRKLTPLFGLHAYQRVNRPVEGNLLSVHLGRGSFPKCVSKVLRGKAFCERPYELVPREGRSTQKRFTGEKINYRVTSDPRDWRSGQYECLLLNKSSESLPEIQDKTVDIILTDPPYYDNLPYSEYSDFFYAWLRPLSSLLGMTWTNMHSPYLESLYVSRAKEKTGPDHENFVKGLADAFRECSRVLKDNGIMVFTFHHRKARAWEALARSLISAGFSITNVFPMKSEGRSGFHSDGGSLKWDSVITCRKLGNLGLGPRKYPHSSSSITSQSLKESVEWNERLEGLDFGSSDEQNLRIGLCVRELVNQQASSAFITEVLDQGETTSS